MSAPDPQDTLSRVQAELDDLAVRITSLAQQVRTVSAGLQPHPAAPAPQPVTPPLPRPEPVGASGPAAPAGASAPPSYIGLGKFGPMPDAPPVPTPPRRRLRVSVADVFAVVGSAITLIGVTFVLVLPQDGVLGQLPRVAIATALAVAAAAAAVWQHARDARNVGAQALMATGVASAYLCVLAVSVLFLRPDGRGLLPDALGLILAGLISIGGLEVARRWESQWLGVLAVLGSLLLAPFVVAPDLIWGLIFMVLLTIVTAPFQLRRTWVVLMAARVVPTALVFLVAAALAYPSLDDNATLTLALAAVLAVAGLGMAVLHQHDTRPNSLASTVGLVSTAAPAVFAQGLADRPLAAVVCAVLGVLYAACGLLPALFSATLRSAAVPLGALFAGFALLRLTDYEYGGLIVFGLAVAHLALAARTRFVAAFVVGLVGAGLGTLLWLPQLLAALFADEAADQGLEAVVESLLGLAVALAAARALGAFGATPAQRLSLGWLGSVAFGSVAVVLAGAELGRLLDRPVAGFQGAHALVTVAWLVLCVLLLRLGLQPGSDGPVAIRLALVLAVGAVAKLFLFDLATLPDLVRALAFLAVGLLLLVIGTWYYRQLDRVRRAAAEPTADEPVAVRPLVRT